MKKLLFITALFAVSILTPQSTSALVGFLNPSFEDPNEGNFWECTGCQDIANYVVQNDGAFNGLRFAVVLNGVSISQKVTVPKKGDTTRLTFWYRNTGDTKVKIKRKGRTLQKVKLEKSRTKWKKMKVDNIPQGKKVRVVIENGDEGYAFFDDFKFRKINRLRVTLNITQDETPIEGATIQVLKRKKRTVKEMYDTEDLETQSVVSDAAGVAEFRIDPSSTKRYVIKITKDGVTKEIALDYPKANKSTSLDVAMTGLVLPEDEEEIEEEPVVQ